MHDSEVFASLKISKSKLESIFDVYVCVGGIASITTLYTPEIDVIISKLRMPALYLD